jgi:hypothetical protein
MMLISKHLLNVITLNFIHLAQLNAAHLSSTISKIDASHHKRSVQISNTIPNFINNDFIHIDYGKHDQTNYISFNKSNVNNSLIQTILNLSDQVGVNNHYELMTKIFTGFLLYSLTVWTVIGNIMVCIALFTNKQLKQGGMSNYLIGNLALSDLLLGLTVLPFSATLSTFKTWPFGSVLCELWLSIDVLCSTASIWGLLVISLDRYIATNHPIKYIKQKNSVKTALIYIAVSWLISIIISLGPLLFKAIDSGGQSKSGLMRIENTDFYDCVLFKTPSFVILSSLGSFFLPLILMIILYTGVFLKIRQQSKMFKNKELKRKSDAIRTLEEEKLFENNNNNKKQKSNNDEARKSLDVQLESNHSETEKRKSTSQVNKPKTKLMPKKSLSGNRLLSQQSNNSEARITKTLAIIMSCFVACWLPFFIIYIIRSQLSNPDSISANVLDIFIWLGYFNSSLNPILYAVLNNNFRIAFENILKCRF